MSRSSDEKPKIIRLSKDDITEIAFNTFVLTLLLFPIISLPLAILIGVVTGIGIVSGEKLFEEEDP